MPSSRRSFSDASIRTILLLLASSTQINGLLTYSSLAPCAQGCAIMESANIQCFIQQDTLCFCNSPNTVSLAQECAETACSAESELTRHDVRQWFLKACENPLVTTDYVRDIVPTITESTPKQKPTYVIDPYPTVEMDVADLNPGESEESDSLGEDSQSQESTEDKEAESKESAPPSTPPKGPSPGVIAGAIAGSVVLILAFLLGAFFLYRRKSTKGGFNYVSKDNDMKTPEVTVEPVPRKGGWDPLEHWERVEVEATQKPPPKAPEPYKQPPSVFEMS